MGLISRVSSRTYRRVITTPHLFTNCTMSQNQDILISNMWTEFSVPKTLASDEIYQNILNIEDHKNDEILKNQAEIEKLKQEKLKLRVISKKPNTIPIPFHFDKRRYSRASKELDELKIQKELEEESHLKVKIRAKKIPKTTYKPFKFKKENDIRTTEILPEFKFVEQDRISKCKFNAWVEQERKNKIILAKELSNFRAKSAPVMSEAFLERQKELEMYRKIKHYVRVDTLLQESKLPFTSDFHRKKERLPSI